jgi:hypothetical protein
MKSTLSPAALTLLLISIAAGPALAQLAQPGPSAQARQAERDARRANTQSLWDDYRSSPRRLGSDTLSKVAQTRSLPPTQANVINVLQLLNASGPSEDRAVLARIAGDLHFDLRQAGSKVLQQDLEDSLSRLAKSERDPAVRLAAVYTYSRMGYFPDSMAMLAGSRPLLGDAAYHAEMAHMLLAAPTQGQLKLIEEIGTGEGHHNDLAKQILMDQVRSIPQAFDRLPRPVIAALLDLFLKQEPKFNATQPSAIGFGSVTDYTNWFNAVVALTAKTNGESPRFIAARLLKLDGDPRKLIAAFWDEHSAALVQSALARADLNKADAAIAAFGARFASNTNVQGFVEMARTNLALSVTQSQK